MQDFLIIGSTIIILIGLYKFINQINKRNSISVLQIHQIRKEFKKTPEQLFEEFEEARRQNHYRREAVNDLFLMYSSKRCWLSTRLYSKIIDYPGYCDEYDKLVEWFEEERKKIYNKKF